MIFRKARFLRLQVDALEAQAEELTRKIEELEAAGVKAAEDLAASAEELAAAHFTHNGVVADLKAAHEAAANSFAHSIQDMAHRHEIEVARKDGAVEALAAFVKDTQKRLEQIEAGHNWHIGGSSISHSGHKHIIYECAQCATKILAPEGFIQVGGKGD